MSQRKGEQYKQEKANRKQIMRRQRIMSVVRKCTAAAVAVVLIGWLGFSVYDSYTSNQERRTVAVNYDSVTDYLNGLYE